MNRAAAKVLLKHGSNDKHMKDAVTPDDILIGGVLKKKAMCCVKRAITGIGGITTKPPMQTSLVYEPGSKRSVPFG